jgi:hypothetical protein
MDAFQGTVELKLRVIPKGGTTQEVLGGDIKKFDLRLTSYGWSGALEFNVFDDQSLQGGEKDQLKQSFMKPDLIKIELDVKGWFDETVQTEGELRPALTLRAIVTGRSLREYPVEEAEKGKWVILRRYRIEFADAARVLWGQHQPCQLYAKKKMQSLLTDHAGDTFKLKFDGAPAPQLEQPLLFLGLDPSIGPASFYDFVIWWLDRHRLIFSYQYTATEDTYSVLEEKVDAGTKFPIYRIDVADQGVTLEFPEVPRYQVNVLDSFTGGEIGPQPIVNPYAVDKIRRDTLLRTALQDPDFSGRADLEKLRLVPTPSTELTVVFKKFPAKALFPGDLVEFTQLQGWDSTCWQYQKDCRVVEATLAGTAVEEHAQSTHGAPRAEYRMSFSTRLELQTDKKTPRLPAFVEPTYPVHVEGKILSTVGSADEETHDPKVQSDGLFAYMVQVPLWKETADQIPVPYNPGRLPGQLYFPAYKNERVLLALTWHKAWIESFLDWREGVRTPEDLQGNHMLLGKNTKSRTSLINYYENESSIKPIFLIGRTNNDDLQTIRISEGNLRIEVTEDAAGLPFKVENVDESKQD